MEHGLSFALIAIFANYVLYAWNVFSLAKKRKLDRRRAGAFAYLSLIFVLCGACHLTGLLPHSFAALREATYWVLAISSFGLYPQATVMAEMIREERK